MQETSKLPKGKFMIGTREISKAVRDNIIKQVFVAANCPEELLKKISGAEIIRFSGDQRELAARLGKPFPVAMAGLEEAEE